MSWDPVPFAVDGEGQAVMEPEALRAAAYAACGSSEGVAAAPDAQVLALAVPGASVRVKPGVVTLLNRTAAADGAGQAYVVRKGTEDTVAIAPTAAGVTRTDMVAVILEDPQYAGQPDPASFANGPYVRTVVYQGVSPAATTLADVDPGQTGLALALVNLPVSTTNITPAMLTDLRTIPNPRRSSRTLSAVITAGVDTALTSTGPTPFPSTATFTIPVPSWAARAEIEAIVSGVKVSQPTDDTGTWNGSIRARIGAAALAGVPVVPAPPTTGRKGLLTAVVAGEVTIAAAARGTNQVVALEGTFGTNTNGMQVSAGIGTTGVIRVTFLEDVAADFWAS